MKVWMNNRLVSKEDAKLTVFDHSVLFGDGVFEGIRSYGGRVFQCKAHVDRLYESARAIRLFIPLTKQELTDAIYKTLAANNIKDGYIRLLVTRGPGTLGLSPNKCSGPSVIIITGQIVLYPAEMYADGMAVITAKTRRTSATMLPPSIKSLNYLNNILAKIEAVEAGVAEAIMLNAEGHVAEATGDNVFIVKNRTVVTPSVESGILIGITRRVVLDLCRKLKLRAVERTVTVEELYSADECFLTGTAAEVIPVTRVDDRVIGSGEPGPVTDRLLTAFRAKTRTA